MAELASAWVTILPDTSKLATGIASAMRGQAIEMPVSVDGRQVETEGRTAGALLTKGLKYSAVAAGGAVAGVMGTAFAKGFKRLNSIDQATAKMKALKMSAEQVDSAMESANKAVKGTSFGLDEAAGAAAMASAAGVKLGTDMDRYLKIVADAAAVGGASMSEMGAIFGKVAGKGKLDGEVMAQLMDRQIGILPALADKYKVTTAEASKMVSDGKVSFQDFQEVMEGMVGGGAAKMGQTFSGAMANMNAALGRFGAKLLEPVFSRAPAVFDALTKGIDVVTKAAGPLISGVLDNIKNSLSGLDFNLDLSSILSGITESLSGVWEAVRGPLESMKNTVMEDIVPTFARIGGIAMNVGRIVFDAFQTVQPVLVFVGGLVGGALVTGFNLLGNAIGGVSRVIQAVTGFFADHTVILKTVAAIILTGLIPYMTVLAVGYASVGAAAAASGARQVAAWATSGAGAVKTAATSVAASYRIVGGWVAAGAAAVKNAALQAAAWLRASLGAGLAAARTIAYSVAMGVVRGATVAWTAAQWLLNAALNANPISLIILGLVALGAALAVAWAKSETFRNIVKAAWEGIKTAAGAVVNWFTQTVWPALQTAFKVIGDVVMWLWNNVFVPAFNGIKTVISMWWAGVQVYWNLLKLAFQTIATVVTWLWNTIFVPAFNGIKAVISAAWSVISFVIDAIKAGFNVVGTIAMWLWNNVMVPAWTGIKMAVGVAKEFIGAAIEGIKGFFQSVADKAGQIKDWIVDKWNALVDFFKGLPGKIASTAERIFSPFRDAAKAVFNAIARFWNNTVGRLSFKAPSWVPGIGGKGFDMPKIPEMATGGLVRGPGTGTSDSIIAALSNGESVNTAKSTSKYWPLFQMLNAGVSLIEALRRLGIPGFADGGLVSAAKLIDFAKGVEGKPYQWGGVNWGDCSGAVSAIANFATGRDPFGSRFATGSEKEELAKRGFKPGLGPKGSLNIGWFNGGPYGGHTAATLPDGTNFEMGGARGNGQFGGQAAGADDSQFTDHAHLPPDHFIGLDGGSPTFGGGTSGSGSGGFSSGGSGGGIGGSSGGSTSAFSSAAAAKRGGVTPVWVENCPSGGIGGGGGQYNEVASSVADVGKAVKESAGTQKATGKDAYADAIVAEGKRRGISEKGILTALMVAQTESGMKMYANEADPESMKMHHDAVGSDHDSVGLFQQRNNGAWGTTADRMDPAKSAGMFYEELAKFDYNAMDEAQAAQKVQRSGFADGSNYAKSRGEAEKMLSASMSRLNKQTEQHTEATEGAVDATTDLTAAVADNTQATQQQQPDAAGGGEKLDMGDLLGDAIMETFGFDGSLFANPFEWDGVKGIFKLFGLGEPNNPIAALNAMGNSPLFVPGPNELPQYPGPAGGDIPTDAFQPGGGNTTVDNSINLNGNVGMDPQEVQTSIAKKQNERSRTYQMAGAR